MIRSLRGSENNDKDMGAYVQAADRLREAFDCAVIIIHHCGIEEKRPRGHTSFAGAADAQLAVRRENSDIVVRVEWMKDGPGGDEIASRLEVVEIGLDEDGEPMTSCIVIPSERHQTNRTSVALSARLRHARELLERTIERKGQAIDEPGHSGLTPDRVKAAKIDWWREECYLSLPIDSAGGSEAEREAKRKAFMRVRKDLAARGVIKKAAVGSGSLPERGVVRRLRQSGPHRWDKGQPSDRGLSLSVPATRSRSLQRDNPGTLAVVPLRSPLTAEKRD